ncbi:MAG: hypothetical protein MUF30_01680 [Burkholderiales bacterium]|nr:hypothetical protein [Burkholderiales bacterium]
MRRFGRVAAQAAAGVACLAGATGVQAHGGLAMDQDMCKLTVGHYTMHFAGYQEDAQRSEFCEDIPRTGRTIIVLDFVDDALRDLPVEVRVVRKVDGALDDAPVVFALPPRTYPSGTLTFAHDFVEPGDYVGLVYAGDRRAHTSVFPFAVGADRAWMPIAGGAAALLALGGAGFVIGRQRMQRAIEAAAPESHA